MTCHLGTLNFFLFESFSCIKETKSGVYLTHFDVSITVMSFSKMAVPGTSSVTNRYLLLLFLGVIFEDYSAMSRDDSRG